MNVGALSVLCLVTANACVVPAIVGDRNVLDASSSLDVADAPSELSTPDVLSSDSVERRDLVEMPLDSDVVIIPDVPVQDSVCVPVTETCNGLDDDCDGMIDDGITCRPCDGGGNCSGTCCAGLCVDIFSSSDNCGGCGRQCPTGRRCAGGVCGP